MSRDDLLTALEALLKRADRAAALNAWDWLDHACQDCEGATMPEPMFRCARHAARALLEKQAEDIPLADQPADETRFVEATTHYFGSTK